MLPLQFPHPQRSSDEGSPAGSTFADAHLPKEGAASEPYLPKEGGPVSSAGHIISLVNPHSCVNENTVDGEARRGIPLKCRKSGLDLTMSVSLRL
jgi:hypothetical protein